MIERRLTHRLTSYWEVLAKDDTLPRYEKFNQTSVQDIWPNCMLLVATPPVPGKKDFRYNYIGAKLQDVYAENLLGRQAGLLAKNMMMFSSLNKRIEETHLQKRPVEDSGQFVNDKSKIVKYRAILLPFGTAEEGVTHIVVGLSWREF